MDEKTITAIVSVLLGIIGVAVLAVLVSKQSNTPNVFTAFGNSISQMICVATSPITGQQCKSLTEQVTSIFTPL